MEAGGAAVSAVPLAAAAVVCAASRVAAVAAVAVAVLAAETLAVALALDLRHPAAELDRRCPLPAAANRPPVRASSSMT